MTEKPNVFYVNDEYWLIQESASKKWFFLEVDTGETSERTYSSPPKAMQAWNAGNVRFVFLDEKPPEQLRLGL